MEPGQEKEGAWARCGGGGGGTGRGGGALRASGETLAEMSPRQRGCGEPSPAPPHTRPDRILSVIAPQLSASFTPTPICLSPPPFSASLRLPIPWLRSPHVPTAAARPSGFAP